MSRESEPRIYTSSVQDGIDTKDVNVGQRATTDALAYELVPPETWFEQGVDDPNQQKYLSCLSLTGTVTSACELSRTSRGRVMRWRMEEDEGFTKAERIARDQFACDVLETEAWQRALHGTREPVFYKGEVCGFIRKKSDVLLLALLKANLPHKYVERLVVEAKQHDPDARQTPALPASIEWRKQVAEILAGDEGKVIEIEAGDVKGGVGLDE